MHFSLKSNNVYISIFAFKYHHDIKKNKKEHKYTFKHEN